MTASAEIIDFRQFREARRAAEVPVRQEAMMVWVPVWVFWAVWMAPSGPVVHALHGV